MKSIRWTALRGVLNSLALAGSMGLAFAGQGDIEFPALASSYLKTGDFVGPDHVLRVRPGMDKDQVRLQLGNPHFNEGLFGVSEWDYVFNFYTGAGREHVTCQFKVKYERASDGLWRVASTHWKDAACADLVQPKVQAPVAVSMPAMRSQRVSLSADGLFRFDGARRQDLLPEAQERIARLAAEIQSGFGPVQQITVTGHTDRLGTETYNQALSQARADTVGDLLIQSGLERAKVRAVGVGKRQPVTTDCEGTQPTPELVTCLQPNRRVDIEVVGIP